jgi:hypothetical protein
MVVRLSLTRISLTRLAELLAGLAASVLGAIVVVKLLLGVPRFVYPPKGVSLALLGPELMGKVFVPWQEPVYGALVILIALATALHTWRGDTLGRVALSVAFLAFAGFAIVFIYLPIFEPSIILAGIAFVLGWTWRGATAAWPARRVRVAHA